MIAAERPAYRSWWIVLTEPAKPPPKAVSGPRPLPESNESVRAIRALEAQLKETP